MADPSPTPPGGDPGVVPEAARGPAAQPSLRTLFLTLIVAGATLLLGGAMGAAAWIESRQARQELAREVDRAAEDLAASLTLPIWYLDEAQIEEILDRRMRGREVQSIRVSLLGVGHPDLVRARGDDAADPGPLLTSERPAVHDGQALATVRVAYTTRPMEAALARRLRIQAATLLALDLLLVLGLQQLLWRTVLRPLAEIRRLARAVGSGDPAAPVPAGGGFRAEFAELHQDLHRAWDLLKARYRSIRMSEERYRTFFERGSDGIVVMDPVTRRFLAFNDQACRQLGYTRDEFAGLSLEDIEAQETAPESEAHIGQIMEAGHETFDTHHRTRDGRIREVQVTAQFIRNEGAGFYHSVWRDVTEQNALRARLAQTQKMESLGRLAGGVAHDMNNVLGAILGLASAQVEILPEDSPSAKAFRTILRACERGGKTVRGLLSFARQQPEEVREVDLNALLDESVQLLERTTLATVRLVRDLEPGLPPVRGDANALSLMIVNLCVNAVDAMPGGGTLTLGTRREGAWALVRVADTGTGMPPEVAARACEPFFTTKAPGKGTGLGLSMAFSTMKAHGGDLEIRSQPGQGTEIRLRFPAGEDAGDGRPGPEASPVGARRRLRVLVADDDDLVREGTGAMLERLGHEAVLAVSGEEALARIREGLKPDLVVLDLNMPGLGGAGTLPLLHGLAPDVPVLLATGSLEAFAMTFDASGPRVRLLPKPYSLQDLDQSLRALLID